MFPLYLYTFPPEAVIFIRLEAIFLPHYQRLFAVPTLVITGGAVRIQGKGPVPTTNCYRVDSWPHDCLFSPPIAFFLPDRVGRCVLATTDPCLLGTNWPRDPRLSLPGTTAFLLPPQPEPWDLRLGNCFATPGLVDGHVHLALDGYDFKAARSTWDNPLLSRTLLQDNLLACLKYGLAAVRDGGDRAGLAASLFTPAGNNTWPFALPLVKAAVHALRKQGRYGSFLGPGVTDNPSADTLVGAVARTIASGASVCKVLVSGIVNLEEWGRVGPCQFTSAELGHIVQIAHANGLPVMAHASGQEAIAIALKARVDSIEHGYFITEEQLKEMAHHHIFWVPTLAPVAALSSGSHKIKAAILTSQMCALQQALALKVPLALGTDAGATGVPHGAGLIAEMNLYLQAGLTPEQILTAVIVTNRQLLALPVPGDLPWPLTTGLAIFRRPY